MRTDYQSGFDEGFKLGREYAAIGQFFLDHPVNRLTFDDSLSVRWDQEPGFNIKRPKVTKDGLQLLQQEADKRYQRVQEIESEHPTIVDGESEISRMYLRLKEKIDELMSVAV